LLAFSVTFLPNIIKNLSMLSRVIAKNVGDVFLRHSVKSTVFIVLFYSLVIIRHTYND